MEKHIPNASSPDASSPGSMMRGIALACEPAQNRTAHQVGGIVLHEVLGVGDGEQGPGVLKPLPGGVESGG